MLANDKNAMATMQQLYTDFEKISSDTTEEIIKVLSVNYRKIMNAALCALQIEQDMKELRTLLIERSKLIFEISNISRPQYFNNVSTDPAQSSEFREILTGQKTELFLETEHLFHILEQHVIERNYSEIRPTLDAIGRLCQNFDASVQQNFKLTFFNTVKKVKCYSRMFAGKFALNYSTPVNL